MQLVQRGQPSWAREGFGHQHHERLAHQRVARDPVEVLEGVAGDDDVGAALDQRLDERRVQALGNVQVMRHFGRRAHEPRAGGIGERVDQRQSQLRNRVAHGDRLRQRLQLPHQPGGPAAQDLAGVGRAQRSPRAVEERRAGHPLGLLDRLRHR